MAVLRFQVLVGAARCSVACEGIEITEAEWPRDRAAVEVFVEACRRGGDADRDGFYPSVPGLLGGENPLRSVQHWLAWPVAARERADSVVGLVSLAITHCRPAARFSIAGVLVHPSSRRQGVATALVARAIEESRIRNATEVHAETLGSWTAAAAFWRRIAAGPDVGRWQSSTSGG